MHPEVRQDHPGTCPKCGGMKLVPETELGKKSEGSLKDYSPLFIIVGLIFIVSFVLVQNNAETWREGMRYFMAGFFLVFAGLKLLDVPGFAEGYSTYDLLAQRVKAYGFVYPFLELGLGLSYLTNFKPVQTNWVTLVLMLFSGLGVAISLMQGKKFQCACLGTMIKVPLTKITLIEDFGMAAMAAVMLFL